MSSEAHQRVGEGGAGGGAGRPSAGASPDFAAGTHLVTLRRGYLHHGIYVGDGRVVHYAGLSSSLRRGPVEEVSLERFAAGRPILIKPESNARYGAAEIVTRARSRLGENRYRITSNNCEHFCEWCVAGEPRSEQVDHLLGAPLLALFRRFTSGLGSAAPIPADRPTDECAV